MEYWIAGIPILHQSNEVLKLTLPFEFVIEGPPVSQQARRREKVRQWRDEVRKAAAQNWPAGELPIAEPVMLTITYFYVGVLMDVDNIPKPISDALQGLVYGDDELVTDVLCRKRNRNTAFRIKNPSSVLADRLGRGKEFLYIVVDKAPDQEVI